MGDFANAPVSACPACGGPLFGDERFCTTCGVELATLYGAQGGPNAADTVVGTCSHCGGPLYKGDSFCTNCGADVPNASGTVVVTSANDSWSGGHDSSGMQAGRRGTDTVPVNGGRHPVDPHVAPANPPAYVGSADDDVDEPLVRSVLVRLTRQEARTGCRKHVMVEGQSIPVDVPAGANVHTHVDIPNLGYRDERTGVVGPLRVCFHVV